MKKVLMLIFVTVTFCFLFAFFAYYSLKNFSVGTKVEDVENIELDERIEYVEYTNPWNISIPKINLEFVNITEGVTKEILDKSVGHFPNTSITDGNVCLASHNRGESGVYFSRLNELEIKDRIIYATIYSKKEYEVTEKKIIEEKDLSILEPSDINKITLITCVNDSPNLRLCVVAEEVESYEKSI